MKKFKEFSLRFLFKVSEQPVLIRDLLEANAFFNDGMLVDPSKLNFNFKILNSYIYFGVFCAVILLPLLLITHYFLTKLDFHISIVSAVMVTACVTLARLCSTPELFPQKISGARGRTRTDTRLPLPDFESGASTSFTTRAHF